MPFPLLHRCGLLAVVALVAGSFYSTSCHAFTNLARKPLRGEIEWRYATYTSDPSDGEGLEASHFTQRYAFLYSLAGYVYSSRGGKFNLDLGFEWVSLDGEFGDDDNNQSEFKLLYNGELLLAPRALPVRLRLFSYDLTPSYFVEVDDYAFDVISPRITTGINQSGRHQVTGFTLEAGESRLPENYYGVLKNYPSLYIDYHQMDVDDPDARDPAKYRVRELALAALNKKNNWVHYRYYEHDDFIDNSEDIREQEVQVGNVDLYQQRLWTWITNWIRLSTDATLTVTDEGDALRTSEFDYNLFVVTQQNRLALSNFNNFYRRTRGDITYRTLEVPFIFDYVISQDRSVRGQLILERGDNVDHNESGDESYDDLYLYGKLETGRTRPVRIDPGLAVEFLNGRGVYGRGQSARGEIEVYSNPRFSRNRQWSTAYALAYFRGSGTDMRNFEQVEEDTDFIEQELVLSLSRQLTPRTQIGLMQTLVFGIGELNGMTSRILRPVSEEGLWNSDDPVDGIDDQVLHATTSLFLDYSRARSRHRFDALFDFYDDGGVKREYEVNLRHRYDYSWRALSVGVTNELTTGDYDDGRNGTASESSFEHYTVVDYNPNRAWDASGSFRYFWRDRASTQYSGVDLNQRAAYSFYRPGGRGKRWLKLEQEAEYSQIWRDAGDDYTYYDLRARGYYYPLYWLYLSSEVEYQSFDPGGSTLTYGIGIGADFPLFKVEASYDYGYRDEDDGYNVRDHRWELNLRKTI